MSFSHHLNTNKTTSFQPTFNNAWFTRPETEALTKALHHSISGDSAHSQTVSTSGTEPEPEPVSKRTQPPPATKKITKRKSRASKGSQTTFIVADPDNFREMVQQVTGIRFDPGSVVRPESCERVISGVNRIPGGCLLPTLDTSAFLLDHHHKEVVVGPTGGGAGAGNGSSFGFGLGGVETGRTGFDFDGLPSFPTLESWKVM